MNPDEKVFNMFFEKADCSVSPPHGSVTRPAHVALLDYEIELALVFRKAITGPVTITADNMHEYVFGITIANDVSARDVQIPQMQFFKGKSYRGFCPLGPHLAVLEREEFAYLDQLTLTLAVNGEVRQHDETKNLVYKPAETISELSTFSDVSPGDVLLTGTPSGCALRVPPPLVRKADAARAAREEVLGDVPQGAGQAAAVPEVGRPDDRDDRERGPGHRSRRAARARRLMERSQ